ncbi:MAG: hypothetical protein ACTSQ5_11795 [Promethearchaeota archaeon]
MKNTKNMKKRLTKILFIICLFGPIYLILIDIHLGVVLLIVPVYISIKEIVKVVKRKWKKKFVSRKYKNLYKSKYTRQSNYNVGKRDDDLLNMYDVSS